MHNSLLRGVFASVIGAILAGVTPAWAETEPSEPGAQFHAELRGSYTQICGMCIAKGNGGSLTSSPKLGVQLYGDYLPFEADVKIGTLRAGPYGTVGYVGKVAKVAVGFAVTLQPRDSRWEFLSQAGMRYTSDKMHYKWNNEDASQGEGAFNLALGVRYFLSRNWYVSFVGEHDSNGRRIGIKFFSYNGGYNPGVDSLMIGFGKTF